MNYKNLGFDTRKMEGIDLESGGGSLKKSLKQKLEKQKITESPEILENNDLTLNFSLFLPEGREVLEVQKELQTTIDFLKVALNFEILPPIQDFLQIREKEDNILEFSFIIPDFELEKDELKKEKILEFLDVLLFQMKRNNKLQAFFTGGVVGEDLGILSSDIIYKANCSDVCETVKAYVTGRENLEGFAKNYLEILNTLKDSPEMQLVENQGQGMFAFDAEKYFSNLGVKYWKFLYENNEEIFRVLQEWKQKKFVDKNIEQFQKQLKKEAIIKVANETLSWMYMLEQDHKVRLNYFKEKFRKEHQDMSTVDLSEISTRKAVDDVLLSEEALKNQTYLRKVLYKASRSGLNLYTKTFLYLHGEYLKAERKEVEAQVKHMFFHLDNENLDITEIFNLLLKSARKVEEDLSKSHFAGKVYSQGLKLFPKSIVRRVDFLLSTKEALETQTERLKQAEKRREKLFKNSQEFDIVSALSRGINPDLYKNAFEAPIKK